MKIDATASRSIAQDALPSPAATPSPSKSFAATREAKPRALAAIPAQGPATRAQLVAVAHDRQEKVLEAMAHLPPMPARDRALIAKALRLALGSDPALRELAAKAWGPR